GSPRLALAAGAAGRRRGRHVFFGGFLVFVTPIIGNIKAAPFKNQASPGTDEFAHLAFAPLFLRAKVLRANLQRLVRDGLEFVELLSTLLAHVLVSRHRLLQ